eukprot:m.186520 g.186520  ORF g.186520 m.186520 type:complete len:804 (+) comp13615_c0_seq3:2516-4927(+)
MKMISHVWVPPSILPFPPAVGKSTYYQLKNNFSAHEIKLQFVALELFSPPEVPRLPGVTSWRPPQRFLFSFKPYKLDRQMSRVLTFTPSPHTQLQQHGVLHEYLVDGQTSEEGGFSISFCLDHSQFGEDPIGLSKYMSDSSMKVDVFDADSLLLIGRCSFPFHLLLRGEYRAVQSSATLDIINSSIQHQRRFIDLRNTTIIQPVSSVVGRLCLRMCNVGSPSVNRKDALNALGAQVTVGDQTTTRLINPIGQTRKYKGLEVVPKLVGANSPLFSARQRDVVLDEACKRKIDKYKCIKQSLSLEKDGVVHTVTPQSIHRQSPFGDINGVRDSSELRALKEYRHKHKDEIIQKHLMKSISTVVNVFVSYGEKAYLEYRLCNPNNNQPLTVVIKPSCKQLAVVTDVREWKALAAAYNCNTTPEEDMFLQAHDGFVCVLRPLEEVIVPFKYMLDNTLLAYQNSTLPQSLSSNKTTHSIIPLHEEIIFEVSESKQQLGVVSLVIHPQAPVIDEEVDLYSEQHSTYRHRLRMPSSLQSVSGVLCSDDAVLYLEGSDSQRDVIVKCVNGASPSIRSFLVVFYNDNNMCIKPTQVWRVNVHAVETYRMTTFLGEESHALLTFRPPNPIHHAQAFSSDRQQLHIEPNKVFPLIGQTLNEIGICVHPTQIGEAKYIVNVVNLDAYKVVYSFQVIVTTKLPQISKTFEVVLKNGMDYINKKIGYTNRYKQSLHFNMYTTSPSRVSFKHRSIVFSPGEKKSIGFRVHSSASRMEEEVLVLAINQNKNIEETFRIIIIQHSSSTTNQNNHHHDSFI